MIFEFPRDIQNRIISKLDIDTRRSLGIYVKLKVPQSLIDKITLCYNKIISSRETIEYDRITGMAYSIDIYINNKKFEIVHEIGKDNRIRYFYIDDNPPSLFTMTFYGYYDREVKVYYGDFENQEYEALFFD